MTRFRIIGKGYRGCDKWNTVYVSDDESFFQKQSVARDSELTHNEIDNWSNLLIKVLPKNTLFWTPFFQTHFHKIDNEYIENKLGYDCTITYESKGTVIDNHWGENAHQVVGDWLVDKFKNQNKWEDDTKVLHTRPPYPYSLRHPRLSSQRTHSRPFS